MFAGLSLWRRALLILLIPVVFVTAVVVLAIILVPISVLQGSLLMWYWIRWKVCGIPIPPKGESIDTPQA